MPLYVRTLLLTASSEEAAPILERHKDHVAQLRAQGRLRVAGAFPHGEGFLEIFEAKDLLEAEAIGRSSPLIEEGLGAWILRELVDLTT